MSKKEVTVKSLNDLKPNGIFSFYGVVTFVKNPQKTRGTDYFMQVRVTDPTWKKDPINCILFGKTLEFFPKVERHGDIVRFHRVKTCIFNGQLQGGSSPGFAALVFKNGSTSSDPISTTRHYSFGDEDKKIVKDLQDWARAQAFCLSANVNENQIIDCIENIKQKRYFDLMCQVVAIRELDDTQVVFKVWDGTKPPIEKAQAGNNYLVPIVRIVPNSHPLLLWHEDLKKGLEKYIADVSIFDDHVQTALKIKPGDFIQFNNLHSLVPVCAKNASAAAVQIELCLHHGTSFNRGIRLLTAEETKTLEERMKPVLKSRKGDLNEDGTPRTLTLIKSPKMAEFSVNTFFNFTAQVVAMWHMSPTHVVLKVADGSKPPAHLSFLEVPPDDPDDVVWMEKARDCVGGHTLDISILDDHAEHLDNIKVEPGDIVRLNNLHVFRPKKKDGEPNTAATEAIEICLHGGTAHNRELFKISPDAGVETILNVDFLIQKQSGVLSDSCFSQSQSQDASQANPSNHEQVVSDSQEPSTSGLGPSTPKWAKVSTDSSSDRYQSTTGENFEVDGQTPGRTSRSSAKKPAQDCAQLDVNENERLSCLTSCTAKQTVIPVATNQRQTVKSSATQELSDPMPSSQLAVSTIANCIKRQKDKHFDELVRIKARVANISTEYASKAFMLFCKNCNFMSHYPQKQHRLIPSSNFGTRTKILDDIYASVASDSDHQQELIFYDLKSASVDDFELVQDMLFIRKAKRLNESGEKLTGTIVCNGAWMDVMNVQKQQLDGSVKYSCPICSQGQSPGGALLARKFLVTFTVHDFSGEMQVSWIKNVDRFCRQPDSDDSLTPECMKKAYTLLSTMSSLDKPLSERPLLDITVELIKKENEKQTGTKIVKCCGPSIDLTLNEANV